jgi:hypothetical protein
MMERSGKVIIFHFPMIESFQRRERIKRKQPFIVGSQQLYLPDLAIDLRENESSPHKKKAN